MPQDRYVLRNQSTALWSCGDPERRGPMESASTCERRSACDFFIPNSHIIRRTGSSLRKFCALEEGGRASAAERSKRAEDRAAFGFMDMQTSVLRRKSE